MAEKKKKEAKKKDVELEDIRDDEYVLTEGPVDIKVKDGVVTVKPWSFGVFRRLGSNLDALVHELILKDIDVTLFFARPALFDYAVFYNEMMSVDLSKASEDDAVRYAFIKEKYEQESVVLLRLVASCADHVLPIIVETCDLTEEEIDEMDSEDVMRVFMCIMQVNHGMLGNASGLFGNRE
jgi:hypothetical protein